MFPDGVGGGSAARGAGDRWPAAAVVERLEERRTLLVLDAFEHLLDAAAVVAGLLAAAGEVACIVTSQASLGLRGERRFVVSSLNVPPTGASELELRANPAVQLFAERAWPGRRRRLEHGRLEAVGDVCRLVDGLPLAIELAAARLGDRPPADLARDLRADPRSLDGPVADLAPRHWSLSALWDRSLRLLDADARALFPRLSVFDGGWTLEAAEWVCGAAVTGSDRPAARASGAGSETLWSLEALVRSSLVEREVDAAGRSRFTMPGLVRRHAAALLRTSGDEPMLRRRQVRAPGMR